MVVPESWQSYEEYATSEDFTILYQHYFLNLQFIGE